MSHRTSIATEGSEGVQSEESDGEQQDIGSDKGKEAMKGKLKWTMRRKSDLVIKDEQRKALVNNNEVNNNSNNNGAVKNIRMENKK